MSVSDCGCGGGYICPTNQKIYFPLFSYLFAVTGFCFTYLFHGNFNINFSYLKNFFSFTALTLLSVQYYSEISDMISNLLYKGDYKPITKEELAIKKIETIFSPKKFVVDGSSKLIKCNDNGCKIWLKDGPHLVIAGKGDDKFFFSLCSTKIIKHQVTVIDNFNPKLDKIAFFCSKKEINLEDITIINKNNQTCVEVLGKNDLSAICFAENIDIIREDIILTTLGQVKDELNIE